VVELCKRKLMHFVLPFEHLNYYDDDNNNM
jgi:hypothetical protein